jgi:hypothetical protein
MSFLTAEWRKLILANYLVDPKILHSYVPQGTELDFWQGNCYASLVGFMFTNVKLLGVPIPFHTRFEEVNLRFYVKRRHEGEWRRGVVFIKEIVPRAAITFVANSVYGEHYETLPMRHEWVEEKETQRVAYEWKQKGQWQSLSVTAKRKAQPIPVGSEISFITEHYWGYTKINQQKTTEYQVTHPSWEYYPLIDYKVDTDFAKVYGERFAFLNDAQPASVMLAEGSPITVEQKNTLR